MRLGQLARKLAIRPTEITEFLTKENILLESGSNTKLEDELAIYIVKQLAPDKVEAMKAELAKESGSPIDEAPVEMISLKSEPEIAVAEVASILLPSPESVIVEEPAYLNLLPNSEEMQQEKSVVVLEDDIIRAPKVELPGLKVLGKIEIPEPKKKEISASTEESISVEENAVTETPVQKPEVIRERRPRPEKKRDFERSNQRSTRNPIAEQREREAEKEREKKEEAARIEKERRTLHYMKKVKVSNPVKLNTFLDESPSPIVKVKKEVPTSFWGRFKNWLKS